MAISAFRRQVARWAFVSGCCYRFGLGAGAVFGSCCALGDARAVVVVLLALCTSSAALVAGTPRAVAARSG